MDRCQSTSAEILRQFTEFERAQGAAFEQFRIDVAATEGEDALENAKLDIRIAEAVSEALRARGMECRAEKGGLLISWRIHVTRAKRQETSEAVNHAFALIESYFWKQIARLQASEETRQLKLQVPRLESYAIQSGDKSLARITIKDHFLHRHIWSEGYRRLSEGLEEAWKDDERLTWRLASLGSGLEVHSYPAGVSDEFRERLKKAHFVGTERLQGEKRSGCCTIL